MAEILMSRSDGEQTLYEIDGLTVWAMPADRRLNLTWTHCRRCGCTEDTACIRIVPEGSLGNGNYEGGCYEGAAPAGFEPCGWALCADEDGGPLCDACASRDPRWLHFGPETVDILVTTREAVAGG